MSAVRTCLWFEEGGEAAAEFYVSLIPGSAITSVMRPDPSGPALMVEFHLAGTPYQILSGGPQYKLSPAASIVVITEDQPETDRLWSALTADGGAPSRCGWLTDRFGVSWQIVPAGMGAFLGGPDAAGRARATEAMLAMDKIDLAALETAYNGA